MNPRFHILIPSRLGSTRLANKALLDIAGLPLIVRVLQAARAANPTSVHVVTDSDEIASAVKASGGDVMLSSADHASGTDRLCEAVGQLALSEDEIVVNLQGDEPLMPKACIEQVAMLLANDGSADMSTLYTDFENEAQWQDFDVVKLVSAADGQALAFSRAAIPHPRDHVWPAAIAKRHVGLYGYRVGALKAWSQLPISEIELTESLEQWRALSAGWRVVCAKAVAKVPAGVDNAHDLDRVRGYFSHEQ